MSTNRKSRKRQRPICAELQSDDGIDPRDFFRESSRKGNDRKTRQLCKQVSHTLYLLLGEFSEPILQDLTIDSVVPAPDSSRLLVNVRPTTRTGTATAQQVLASLDRVRGYLRSEVAAAICRRRAPDLVFEVSSPGEVSP